jgi:membrane protein
MITARNAFKLLRTSFDDWNEDDGPRLGAALAFYTILSISPIVILAVAMVSLVFDRSQAQTHLLDQVQSLIGPEGRNAVQTLLASGQKKASGIVATLAGFVILVFGASGVFGELRSALNTIWEAKPQVGSGISGMLRERFFSIGMVFSVGYVLLISLLVSTALAALTTFLNGLLPLPSILSNTLNFIISFLGVAVLFGFILKSFLKQRSGGRMFE